MGSGAVSVGSAGAKIVELWYLDTRPLVEALLELETSGSGGFDEGAQMRQLVIGRSQNSNQLLVVAFESRLDSGDVGDRRRQGASALQRCLLMGTSILHPLLQSTRSVSRIASSAARFPRATFALRPPSRRALQQRSAELEIEMSVWVAVEALV